MRRHLNLGGIANESRKLDIARESVKCDYEIKASRVLLCINLGALNRHAHLASIQVVMVYSSVFISWNRVHGWVPWRWVLIYRLFYSASQSSLFKSIILSKVEKVFIISIKKYLTCSHTDFWVTSLSWSEIMFRLLHFICLRAHIGLIVKSLYLKST